jgi:tetratricopeptide (TPR) repeat protein
MLSKAKHLVFSSEYEVEIFRLSPRTDITTQSRKKEGARNLNLLDHAGRSFNTICWLNLVAVLLFPSLSPAAAPCDPPIAKIQSVQGNVEVRRAGQTQWQRVRLNDTYCAGDRVQVGERSRAAISLVNQPILRLDQNTTITFGGVREERTSLIELLRGTLYFFSRLPRNLEIITAFVNAGVEGTEGLVRVEADRALLSIFEGRVLAVNQTGKLALASGQSALAEQGKPPAATVVVNPRDAVRWTLYYPPTIHFRRQDFPAGADWQGMVRNSLDAYIKGDLQAAFEAIKGVPDTLNEPRFFVYRASLLLSVGRVEEANRDLDRALSLNPAYSDALALRSIIAVTQNDRAAALDLAKSAVTADPNSAGALIALSYAQQAAFNLEDALGSLKQAVQVGPENALAWARLAELHMSFAELDQALQAAQRAAALEPNVSRTQTVLGFAYLTQVNTTESKIAFARAIELDQADPLPRLGLGLATIRDGDLEEGRREIEIAVSLDPDSSLMRSYLGKAYFEEKRNMQAAAQYEMAKQFDSRDPTPYFYDAIRKQTENRPVEALQDMQKAIELNDNRAVYRSRQLLDSDLAARSASQARIYSDLGFQQLALVEGWKSVNTDPTNYSAHRFLADSYSILPRHEIARVSELLQSQLLQPLNMTPIQPRLAESNLFLISAGGPAGLSFNEFHPLFNRNGVNFQTTGLAGENDTYAGEGVLSGIYKKASFSVGGFHFNTNGWRKNSDQKDTIANAFVQLELTPQTSVQAEVRRRETDLGDLQQRFFPEVFDPVSRRTIDSRTIRFGGRHSFTPNALILASLILNDRRETLFTPGSFLTAETKVPQSSYGIEVQHHLRWAHLTITSGVGYFDVSGRHRQVLTFPLFPFFSPIFTNFGRDIQHLNSYLYATVKLFDRVTATGGVSFDYVRGSPAEVVDGKQSQANPKVGITWNPLDTTSVRVAATRVLKRTLITNETLEPTQVAGFNQFFDDLNRTKAWRYGIGIDQKITNSLFGGMEFSRRDLEIPLIFTNPISVQTIDGREYQVRNYVLWTPHPWIAARSEYLFDRFNNAPQHDEGFKVSTHRVPIGINIFHPTGWSLFTTGTYYDQSVNFPGSENESERSRFWTVDAGINYRLPKRHGIMTVGAANLFDRRFKYFDTDFNNPRIQPRRTIFFRATFTLP